MSLFYNVLVETTTRQGVRQLLGDQRQRCLRRSEKEGDGVCSCVLIVCMCEVRSWLTLNSKKKAIDSQRAEWGQ
jgi:hypothetical protein